MSLPRYRRGASGQVDTARWTSRPAASSSSVIWPPDWPVPTIRAAPAGSCSGLRCRADRCTDGLRVRPHVIHDVRARHEGLRVGAVVGHAGQHERKVRRVQDEGIPPVLPRASDGGAPLEQLVFDAGLAEPVARGQARLPGADNEGVHLRGITARGLQILGSGVSVRSHGRSVRLRRPLQEELSVAFFDSDGRICRLGWFPSRL
jgi:hypothetical protein